MSPFLLSFLVILAAFFHAVWNALAKHSQERDFFLGLVALGHFFLGLILSIFVPFPDLEAWPFILVSALVHYLYFFALDHAYAKGGLSVVYPVARGMAPPLVSLGGLIFAEEILSGLTWMGIIVCSLGLIMFAIPVKKNLASEPSPSLLIILGMAVITGLIISCYSVLDGLGARVTDPLSYIAWLFIFEVAVFFKAVIKNHRRLKEISGQVYRRGLWGGGLGAVAYALVIYVKSQMELGMVSTLRETSIVFASLIAILILKERPWKLRLTASLVVVTGIMILFLDYS